MVDAKLAAFTQVPVSRIRAGMAALNGGTPNWLDIQLPSAVANFQQMFTSASCGNTVDSTCTSTWDAFSGCIPYKHCSAMYVPTALGRSSWISLLPDVSNALETIDLAEGFNSFTGGCETVRIGFRANDDGSGVCPDSAIGFGMLNYGYSWQSNCTVGSHNFGTANPRFGYILAS